MIKKLRCTWYITCNMLFGKLLKNFLILLLLISVCLLIGVSFLVLNFKSYDELEIKKLCNVEQVGHIYMKDSAGGLEKETAFYNSVKALPYVDCIGDFANAGFQEKKPVIARMQDSHHYTSAYDGTDLIEMTFMDRKMLRIFDLRGEYENTEQKEGIILGYQYREKYQNKSVLECDGEAVPILGFTEKGSKWLSDIVGTNFMPDISALVDTGYMCFYIFDGEERMGTGAGWFRLQDAGDYPKFMEEVEKLAEEQDIPVSIYPMTEYIRLEAERNGKIFAELSHYALVAMGIIILFLILIKLYSFWRNKRQYGVFYASGMTGRKIIASIWMENGAIFYMALLIAYIILWNSFAILAQVGGEAYGALEGVVKDLLCYRVFAEEFIIVSVCCTVTSAIPAFVFNRIPPLSMVKSFYE